MRKSVDEILLDLEQERMARKESERILESKYLEVYEQRLEIESLKKKLDKDRGIKLSKTSKIQRVQQEVFEVHPFSILIYSLSSLKILNVNQTAVNNYGYSKSEFYKLSITDLHDDEDNNVVINHINAIKKGHYKTKVWRHLKKNSEVALVKITGVTIEFDGESARIVIVEDVTELKALEVKNEIQQKKYIDLIEKSSDLMFGMLPDGTFLFVNRVACKITGYSERELLSINFRELVRSDYEKRVVSFYSFQLESQTETTYTEFPIISRNGDEIWLGQSVNISRSKTNKIEFSAIARVITEKKTFEKALLRSEDKFRSIIENMNLGLLETDRDGNIVKAYKSFCKIVGYLPEELEGTDGAFLLDGDAYDIMTTQKENRIKGEFGVYEIQITCKDKSKKWVMISGAPFYDQNDGLKGSIGIHLDISERKNIEAQLLTAKNVAEDSLRAKEVFLANISHEIRTPLNAIVGLSELLKKSELDSNQKEMILQVSVASGNLLNLINDLLLLSKVEANGIILKPNIYSLQYAIEETFMMFENGAREKELEFVLDLNLKPNSYYEFDRLRFVQIIQNLLSNAIKFTSEGYIKISAYYNYSIDKIEIKIEDSGMGIPEDEMQSIFEGFVQGSNNEPDIHGGTGLGLSIVNNIVKMMGGEIHVNKLKVGTCFTLNFSFPEKDELQIDQKQLVEYDVKELEGVKILVTEDNIVNQSLIKKILSDWNVEHIIVNNGKEALDRLEHECFDIVLMDIRMPILNGIDATKLIRKVQKNYELRIIALTANTLNEGSLEYWEAGFNDVLMKPFVQDELLEMLILNSSRRTELLRGRLIKFAQEDTSFAEILRSIFIDDSSLRILDMMDASSIKDLDKISSIAHSMKPSLDQLASKNIQELNRKFDGKKIGEEEIVSKIELFGLHMGLLIEDLKRIVF